MSNMWVQPNAKCICVESQWGSVRPELQDPKYRPVFMAMYTIRAVTVDQSVHLASQIGISLQEMPEHPQLGQIWYTLYNVNGKLCFRPLEPLPEEEHTKEVELT
jgi:hypothetical protein